MNGFLPSDADETTEVILFIKLLALVLVVQIFSLKVTLGTLCKCCLVLSQHMDELPC